MVYSWDVKLKWSQVAFSAEEQYWMGFSAKG